MGLEQKIAGIYYPKKRLILKNEKTLKYIFQMNDKDYFDLELSGISAYPFLEYNKNEELVVRKNFTTVTIYNKQLSLKQKVFNLKNRKNIEFSLEGKIIQFYSLSNNTYLVSLYDVSGRHNVVLLDSKLKIVKQQKVGLCSWHGQNAIYEKDGIIMYAEYNTSELPQKVSLFRSKDMGYTWKEVFSLNAPEQLRHWHTLQADSSRKNHWIATTGDTPAQSKWYLSKDDGNTWNEITDKNYINTSYPNRSLSAHRTTAIEEDNTHFHWTTDDLMGNVNNYFVEENGERKSSSKLYKSKKGSSLELEKLTNLGIHGRSFIKTKSGYLVITEAKYVSYNMQIFYIDDKDTTKAYFLLSLPGELRTGGTYSMNSTMDREQSCYLKLGNKSYFLGEKHQTIKLSLNQIEHTDTFAYEIKDYFKFEEHLWFLNNIKSLENIHFSNNKVQLTLKDTKNTFYLLLGDATQQELKCKELFYLKGAKAVSIGVNLKQNENAKISLFLQTFDEDSLIATTSFPLISGDNTINHNLQENEKYVKLLFRISCNVANDIEFSHLNLILS